MMRPHPSSWYTPVTVLRNGGRDARGNQLPAQRIEVADCLFGWTATDDPADRTDVPTSEASLYRHTNDFHFLPTDQIELPASHPVGQKLWNVAGEPQVWPKGVTVPLTSARRVQ